MTKVIAFLYKRGKAMTATAMVVTLGVTMIGAAALSSTAEAATLTDVKDTLSDSSPSSASNHTIQFTTPTGIPASGTLTLTFNAGFNMNSVAFGDIDLADDGVDVTLAAAPTGATWGAVLAGQVITFTNGSGAVAAGSVITIEIGFHATTGVTGDSQIINPATSNASYDVAIATSSGDSATLYVVVLPNVELTADVTSFFNFEVRALPTGTYQTITTDVASTDGAADFGTVVPWTDETSGSSLSASTNAESGFSVTLEQNHNMLASSGADIDSFQDGVPATTAAWSAPAGTNGSELTYGHLGFHSTDFDAAPNDTGDSWFGLTGVTQETVFAHASPTNGTTEGEGLAKVLYRIEVSDLQEPGHYENRLMYIATATF